KDKARCRIARFLSKGPARMRPAQDGGRMLLEAEGHGTISVERAALAAMARAGELVQDKDAISLAPRHSGEDAFGNRHRDLGKLPVDAGSGMEMATVNLAE